MQIELTQTQRLLMVAIAEHEGQPVTIRHLGRAGAQDLAKPCLFRRGQVAVWRECFALP